MTAGYAEVPIEPTEEIRRAIWSAQYRYRRDVGGYAATDADIATLVDARLADASQRDQDRVAWQAMIKAGGQASPPPSPTAEQRALKGLMGKIQHENICDRTGQACRSPAKTCGCWMEAQAEMDVPLIIPEQEAKVHD